MTNYLKFLIWKQWTVDARILHNIPRILNKNMWNIHIFTKTTDRSYRIFLKDFPLKNLYMRNGMELETVMRNESTWYYLGPILYKQIFIARELLTEWINI